MTRLAKKYKVKLPRSIWYYFFMGQVTLLERTKCKFTKYNTPAERDAFDLTKFETELKLVPQNELPFFKPDCLVSAHQKKLLRMTEDMKNGEIERAKANRERKQKKRGSDKDAKPHEKAPKEEYFCNDCNKTHGQGNHTEEGKGKF